MKFNKQKGQMATFLSIMILIAGVFIISIKEATNTNSSSNETTCMIGEPQPNSLVQLPLPAIKNFSEDPNTPDETAGKEGGPDLSSNKTYRLIRAKVPIDPLDSYYTTGSYHGMWHQNVLLIPRSGPGDSSNTDHFIYYGNYTDPTNNVTFEIYYPSKWGESTLDQNYEFKYGRTTEFRFHQEGILFFLRLKPGVQPPEPETTKGVDRQTGQEKDFWLVDIYQEEGRYQASINGTRGYKQEDIFRCQSGTANKSGKAYYPSTTPTAGSNKKQLQLNYFVFNPGDIGFSAHCKPAIYLYPEKKLDVNVKVNTRGELLLTKPLYPSNGWNITAYPDGKITYQGQNYDYLYYESRIPDSLIKKPKDGFVVKYEDLSKLYEEILPKLGLNQRQVVDFKEYWQRTLPKSPYYFVGIMDEKNVDSFDPLVINPKPVTIVRVRLYFEALEKKIEVKEPKMTTPNKNGFTVVEWGAMVKRDKDHPFTCSE